MKLKNKKFNYIFDLNCTFPILDFEIKNKLACFSIEKIVAVQLLIQNKLNCYDIYFLLYHQYRSSYERSLKFKLLGIRNPSSLIEIFISQFNFERLFHQVKRETYVRKRE